MIVAWSQGPLHFGWSLNKSHMFHDCAECVVGAAFVWFGAWFGGGTRDPNVLENDLLGDRNWHTLTSSLPDFDAAIFLKTVALS